VTDAIGSVTSRGDVALVMLLGLVAAGIAAAAALRRLEGTSTPFNLPCAAAVLKLPTGALTAVLGLVLMRGDFVPGLSALDNSAQILAWAALFGYAQELFTRFADARAQTVLGKVGTPGDQKQPDGTTVPSVTAG
jgi:CBS domain containing-hemolysin-like protein